VAEETATAGSVSFPSCEKQSNARKRGKNITVGKRLPSEGLKSEGGERRRTSFTRSGLEGGGARTRKGGRLPGMHWLDCVDCRRERGPDLSRISFGGKKSHACPAIKSQQKEHLCCGRTEEWVWRDGDEILSSSPMCSMRLIRARE